MEQGDGKLANISTRAFVGVGGRIVIAGFMLGNNAGDDSVVVRGLGPSLTAAGVTNVLANPTLELRNSDGTLQISNNDWQDSPSQAALITAAGLAPSSNLESAIAATLPPGLYTVLLAGLNNTTGNGLVEVYDRGAAGGRTGSDADTERAAWPSPHRERRPSPGQPPPGNRQARHHLRHADAAPGVADAKSNGAVHRDLRWVTTAGAADRVDRDAGVGRSAVVGDDGRNA